MEIRTRNLKRLAARFPSQAIAAKEMGIDRPALSKLLNEKQSLGYKRARDIEEHMGLEEGYLDQYRDDQRDEWLRAYCASLQGGDTPEDAAKVADEATYQLRKRFG